MRPSRTDRLISSVPSIGTERVYCSKCREPTLRKWMACVHCGEIPSLSSKKRVPRISKRFGQSQTRPHDPVTGQFVGKAMKRKIVETA